MTVQMSPGNYPAQSHYVVQQGSYPVQSHHVVQQGSVLKPLQSQSKAEPLYATCLFMTGGTVLLSLLAVVPIWNAVALLNDFNYIFWAGRSVPTVTIIVCIAIVLFYLVTSSIFFRRAHGSAQSEQSVLMIGNIFITLFGLFLVMSSMPLIRQAELTSTNLLHNCDYSDQTHRLYEYSQVLQNLRATHACAKKDSVEECDGYQISLPYTAFLKHLETNFRCSGFCYRPPAVTWSKSSDRAAATPEQADKQTNSSAAQATKADKETAHAKHNSGDKQTKHAKRSSGESELLSTNISAAQSKTEKSENGYSLLQLAKERHPDVVTPLSIADAGILLEAANIMDSLEGDLRPKQTYPPTLFSDANYQASCDGMAARGMKLSAGDIGNQAYFQGVYLVLIAVLIGFLKLFGLCVRGAK